MSSNVCHQIIYLAIELSSSSWVIAYRVPRNDKAKLHRLEAGDGAGLLAFIAGLRHRLDPPDDASTLVVSCFEAGRDGFWLHRLLTAHGVINHVVEPTSILVTRGARRAKTDRLDAVGLLRVLAAKFAGDPGACRTVVVPSAEEEDAKRPHREREFLVQERVRIENRIAALLATQGVRERPSLRSWDADMRALRTGDGRPLPTHLVAELNRLRRRLSLTLEMIRELDAVREQALEAQHDSASRMVKALCTIRGIGVNFASVLTREVFYRTFDNRRQIASYLGLAPTPFQSGGMDRDRRINSTHVRKPQIHQGHVRLVLAKSLNAISAAGGFRYHHHVGLIANNSRKALVQQRMIVDAEDTDFLRGNHLSNSLLGDRLRKSAVPVVQHSKGFGCRFA